MPHRLTARADKDIEQILRETHRMFGPRQVLAYAELMDRAIAIVADEPDRPSSVLRPEIAPEVRSFHIELAGGRSGSAAHTLYYAQMRGVEGSGEIAILRVLHERMEPKLRVLRTLDPER